jgi:gamma-glutamylaminecyclotransferase
MSKHFVFVYGTLKKGEPNYGYMSKFTKGFFQFISKGKTAIKYPLVIGTKYNIPFLLNSPGTGHVSTYHTSSSRYHLIVSLTLFL